MNLSKGYPPWQATGFSEGAKVIICRYVTFSRVPLSAEPRGRSPYVLPAFWGNREFRDGFEIRGIREKIVKGVGKTAFAGVFRPQRGQQKVTGTGNSAHFHKSGLMDDALLASFGVAFYIPKLKLS